MCVPTGLRRDHGVGGMICVQGTNWEKTTRCKGVELGSAESVRKEKAGEDLGGKERGGNC